MVLFLLFGKFSDGGVNEITIQSLAGYQSPCVQYGSCILRIPGVKIPFDPDIILMAKDLVVSAYPGK